jgi:hypothetical protein
MFAVIIIIIIVCAKIVVVVVPAGESNKFITPQLLSPTNFVKHFQPGDCILLICVVSKSFPAN